jgi:hypothetical protein
VVEGVTEIHKDLGEERLWKSTENSAKNEKQCAARANRRSEALEVEFVGARVAVRSQKEIKSTTPC